MSVVKPKIVVFVGAGASRAAFSDSPVMADYFDRAVSRVLRELRRENPDIEVLRIARALVMLDVHGLYQTPNSKTTAVAGHLWDRFRHEGFWLDPNAHGDFLPLVRRYLKEWKAYPVCEDRQTRKRVEDLEKTFIELDQMSDERLLDKRFRKDGEFERSIFTFFASLYKAKTPSSRGYACLRRIIRSCEMALRGLESALIVNFNYDAFLDHALCHAARCRSVAALYGGILGFEIESDGARAKRSKSEECLIWMVKPHGSINWWCSEGGTAAEYACCSMRPDGLFYVPSFGQACFFHRTKWYQPKRWIRPILMAPKPRKEYFGPCKDSLVALISGIDSADEVWIFGWSMPLTDEEVVNSVRKAVKARSRPIRWLRMVDIEGDNKHALEARAREVFMPDRVEGHWRGLQAWRGWSQK